MAAAAGIADTKTTIDFVGEVEGRRSESESERLRPVATKEQARRERETGDGARWWRGHGKLNDRLLNGERRG